MTTTKDGAWTSEVYSGICADPATCLIGYLAPCVLYGQTAEKVQGGEFLNHCLKYYLYSCICLCGLVAGPTRQKLRSHYKLVQTPECLATQDDCIVTSIPCVGICTNCQETRELAARGVVASAPLDPTEFNWNAFAPEITAAAAPTVATQAPAAQEMK